MTETKAEQSRRQQLAQFLTRFYPEVAIGGYSSLDGTVEFYGRINTLLTRDSVVLDFGAGRGAWFEDDPAEYRRNLRLLKGKVRSVIGCDVDAAVSTNRSVDTALIIHPGQVIDVPPGSVDIVILDYVLEHIDDPSWLQREILRILKPGGWVCGRTPSRWSYVALVARLTPNMHHARVLAAAQPMRKVRDVFPTRYRLNTPGAINKVFPPSLFENYTYYYSGEPSYHFNNALMLRTLRLLSWLLPASLHSNLFVFLRRKAG